MHYPKRSSGFTLVELSIVLVIVGVIIGGVMVGNDLIAASQRRSIITDLQKFQSAINAFKNKYGDLPGDIPCTQAAVYFPGGPCSFTYSAAKDGIIAYSEGFIAWYQLSHAGIIEGTYNGIGYSGPGGVILPGMDVPQAKIQGLGYQIGAAPGWIPGYIPTPLSHPNLIALAKPDPTWMTLVDGNFLKPAEAQDLDSKMDDGDPIAGDFRGIAGPIVSGYCIVGANTHAYAISETRLTCYIGLLF